MDITMRMVDGYDGKYDHDLFSNRVFRALHGHYPYDIVKMPEDIVYGDGEHVYSYVIGEYDYTQAMEVIDYDGVIDDNDYIGRRRVY